MRIIRLAILILCIAALAVFTLRAHEILTALHIPAYGQKLLERAVFYKVPGVQNGPFSTTPVPTTLGTPPPPASPTAKAPSSASDLGPVGALNHGYLAAKPFTSLIVEVDNVKSAPPNRGALTDLFSTIDKYSDKPQGILFDGQNEFTSSAQRYSIEDLNAIEKANRTHYSNGTTASLYVVYLNGVFAENENALGVAWNASSIAIFKDRINDALTASLFAPTLERAVLFHELGHLFGLVNINYHSEINHEDKAHPHHSSDTQSVMYWAAEDIHVGTALQLGPSTHFDSDDEADLAKIKSGAY